MESNDWNNRVDEREIVVFADKKIYAKQTILKCLYWYGAQFRTTVSLVGDGTYKISLIPLTEDAETHLDLSAYLHKFERDLIDFSLRDIVTKETANVRDLLIAKAFSHSEASNPPGEVRDPVELAKADNNAAVTS